MDEVATGAGGATPRAVYVVDNTGNMLRSLESLPETRAVFVHSFATVRQFLAAAPNLIAGPIMVDMDMAGEAQTLLEEVRAKNIHWPVILLDGHGDVSLAVSAMKLGASDFIERPIDPHRIEGVLERAFASLDKGASARSESVSARARFAKLTPRQAEVITGLMAGLSNKEVAYRLSISPRTVEMHRASALQRLGLRAIAEVVNLKNADAQFEGSGKFSS